MHATLHVGSGPCLASADVAGDCALNGHSHWGAPPQTRAGLIHSESDQTIDSDVLSSVSAQRRIPEFSAEDLASFEISMVLGTCFCLWRTICKSETQAACPAQSKAGKSRVIPR